MWITILKWICFILVCTDAIAYVYSKPKQVDGNLFKVIGMIFGILARAFVLYGTATCWLLV